MKLITTLSFSFLFSVISFSQNIDSRLLTKYTEAELNEMIENSPNEYALLDYALDNAIYFADGSNPKAENLKEIQVLSSESTFIDLGLEIMDQNQYFQVEGENRILVVKSKWVLNHEMQKK